MYRAASLQMLRVLNCPATGYRQLVSTTRLTASSPGLPSISPSPHARYAYVTARGHFPDALKGEPLTRETASKTDENDPLLAP